LRIENVKVKTQDDVQQFLLHTQIIAWDPFTDLNYKLQDNKMLFSLYGNTFKLEHMRPLNSGSFVSASPKAFAMRLKFLAVSTG